MTIICAQNCGGETWIGSDSRMSAGAYIYPTPAQKWRRMGAWWVAAAGCARFWSLVDQHRDRLEAEEFGNTTRPELAYEALLRLIRKDEWVFDTEDRGSPKRLRLNVLLVSPDLRVFDCSQSGSVHDGRHEFIACGDGGDHAEGAAFALRDAEPRTRFHIAISAAIRNYVADATAPSSSRAILEGCRSTSCR